MYKKNNTELKKMKVFSILKKSAVRKCIVREKRIGKAPFLKDGIVII